MSPRPDVLLDGLLFGEGPRWRDGRLYFSDMHAHRVVAVDDAGRCEEICRVEAQPSGLGWLPDGQMLVVSMTDQKLLRLEPEGLVLHADLSGVARYHCNDMLVDDAGRAYVGSFGFDLHGGAKPVPSTLALVLPDGTVHQAADDMRFPNGTVLTPDGRTLIVGESFGARLTAFDVDEAGGLSGRREWARLEGAVPDGICLDSEGAIWVASPVSAEVLRVHEGGRVSRRVPVETQAFACMLGGDDGRNLYICTAADSDPAICQEKPSGRIEVVRVDAPRAGLP